MGYSELGPRSEAGAQEAAQGFSWLFCTSRQPFRRPSTLPNAPLLAKAVSAAPLACLAQLP
eukprot:4716001-Pleurochrysis_carterae.AAC.4